MQPRRTTANTHWRQAQKQRATKGWSKHKTTMKSKETGTKSWPKRQRQHTSVNDKPKNGWPLTKFCELFLVDTHVMTRLSQNDKILYLLPRVVLHFRLQRAKWAKTTKPHHSQNSPGFKDWVFRPPKCSTGVPELWSRSDTEHGGSLLLRVSWFFTNLQTTQ